MNQLDVSDLDDWLTLGGVRKGDDPTDMEIADSHRNAMKLFWNLSGIDISASSYGVSVDGLEIETEPRLRVCAGSSDEYSVDKSETDTVSASIACTIYLYRYFEDGIFVGYGIGGGFPLESFLVADALGMDREATWITNALNGIYPVGSVVTETTLNDIPFLKVRLEASDSNVSAGINGLGFYTYE
ncbi:hypothetical protein [Puniceicoccus vermicola]|uniref:hypothetical protein n=1 Tax=Puniceicoccus vermicola TaxID=388746 RepID=UPI00163B1507|nr:hypothetical protein [Puniceicoccus vermicola]